MAKNAKKWPKMAKNGKNAKNRQKCPFFDPPLKTPFYTDLPPIGAKKYPKKGPKKRSTGKKSRFWAKICQFPP